MTRTANRPFFSLNVLLIAGVVIVGGLLVSNWLASALYRLLFG